MQAVETHATMDDARHLVLDEALPLSGAHRVRVIILLPDAAGDELGEEDGNEPEEQTWLRAAAVNPAFDFLNVPAEDIYSLADGKPFHDQR